MTSRGSRMPKEKSKKSPAKKPPLSDTERHKRFLDAAKEADADEDSEAFDRAFSKVVSPPKSKD
jgi:hypothetical protein